MKKIILISIMILFLAVNSIEAVSVKVSPSEIKVETSASLTEREITIENPGNNVALFEVYTDDFSDWIKIEPESFILEGGKSQKVILGIKNKETGVFFTTISVVAEPLSEREFKANAGVKIPLEIRVMENKSGFWLGSISESFRKLFENKQNLICLFGAIFILVLFGLLIRKKKKVEL